MFANFSDKGQPSNSQSVPKVKQNSSMRQFIRPIQRYTPERASPTRLVLHEAKENFPLASPGSSVTVEAVVERCTTPESPSLLSDYFCYDDITPEFLDEQVKLEETFTRKKEVLKDLNCHL
jgi:hypothetical protein